MQKSDRFESEKREQVLRNLLSFLLLHLEVIVIDQKIRKRITDRMVLVNPIHAS